MGLLQCIENHYMRHKPQCMEQYVHLEDGECIVLDVEKLGVLRGCSIRKKYFPICNNDTTSWNVYVVITNLHIFLFNRYSCVKFTASEILSIEERKFLWCRYVVMKTATDDCSFTMGPNEINERIVRVVEQLKR